MIALLTDKAAKTMSSREISELTGKDHRHVLADARVMLESLGIDCAGFSAQYKDASGKYNPMFVLPKRETLILVSGYSVAMRAKIIDRWQELEAHVAAPVAPAELSRMDILKLAMESEQARIQAEAERDRAIATKAQIGSRREATAMATAGAAKREAAKLREQLGASARHATVRAVNAVAGHEYDWLPLRHWCKREEIAPVSVTDPLYGEVKAWPAGAWLECHAVDIAAMFGSKSG